ncbi:MAG TPA: hypothetical protein EYH38_04835 [Leucothrix sp.]|nr:hypothetical protein [Leucothrix sp.]
MKIGGENRPEWIMKRHRQRFCETLGVSEKILQREAKRLAVAIKIEAKKLSNNRLFANYRNEPLSKILSLVYNRSTRLLKE